MKRLTICIALLAAMVLSSCSDTDNVDPTREQKTEHNGSRGSGETDVEDIELVRFTFGNQWNSYEPFGFEEDDLNTLKVIRSEEELEVFFKEREYTPSGIDFEKHTLLFVPIYTFYGIAEISYALQSTDNGYHYSMEVTMGMWCVIGNEVCAVLAPAINQNESVSFELTIN